MDGSDGVRGQACGRAAALGCTAGVALTGTDRLGAAAGGAGWTVYPRKNRSGRLRRIPTPPALADRRLAAPVMARAAHGIGYNKQTTKKTRQHQTNQTPTRAAS